LTPEELAIVDALRHEGIPAGSAALAVAMVTREHSRPESELRDIIRQYQHLESAAAASDAVGDLRRRKWLTEEISYGLSLVRQAPDLKQQLATLLKDPGVDWHLSMLRAVHDPYVRVVGQMNDNVVYTSYLDLLRGARSEICLPMMATTPTLSSVAILKERAEKGVRVKVLLGAPSVVARMRGETMRSTAVDAIAGWRAHAQGRRTFEVRIAHKEADLQLATCMLIDGRVLRFDVYDPWHQRSLQGVMLEATSPAGMTLNLITLFKEQFNEAWRRAQPAGYPWAVWLVKREARWAAAVLMVVATFLFRESVVGLAIVGSMAATQVMNALASSRRDIATFFRQRL
jgi:hypothetical protein